MTRPMPEIQPITQAEILQALEDATRAVPARPANTYTVSELKEMWGKSATTVRKTLHKMIQAGTVEGVGIYRVSATGAAMPVQGYRFNGKNGK